MGSGGWPHLHTSANNPDQTNRLADLAHLVDLQDYINHPSYYSSTLVWSVAIV